MKVNIYGAGGHAKVVVDNIESIGWEVKYVYDDNVKLKSFLRELSAHFKQNSAL